MWLELACRAKDKQDLVESSLPDRRTLRQGRRFVGLDLAGIAADTSADQSRYIKATQRTLRKISLEETENPTVSRARIPPRTAEKLKFTFRRTDWNKRVAEMFLEGSDLKPTDERLAALATHLGAAFTLETGLARQTFLGTYR